MSDAALPGFRAFLDAWNAAQGLTTPALHARMADWLADAFARRGTGRVLLAFRGSGKSTVVGLFCAWALVREPALRILVLAAEESLARKMVRNVKRILERHPMAGAIKPKRGDLWAADQFVVERKAELRDPSMLARGLAGNVTGSRAEIVVCDDVEVPNTSDSAAKRADLRERLAELDYVLVPGGLQLYVGTPHSYYSIYADVPREEAGESVPFLAGFERLTIPVVADDGTPAWPERFGPDRIAELRARHGGAGFRAQMMLEPVADGACRLDPARLRRYDGALEYVETNGTAVLTIGGERMVSASCWWDPSWAKADGDRSVVAVVFAGEDGHSRLHEILYVPATADPADGDAQCAAVVEFARRNAVPTIRVEANGAGAFLPRLLAGALSRAGVGAAVVGTHSRTRKSRRILDAFDARLASGLLHAHASVWETPFVAEMRDWNADARDAADDGLDAVAGCLSSEPVRLPVLPKAPPPGWRKAAAPHRADAKFEP